MNSPSPTARTRIDPENGTRNHSVPTVNTTTIWMIATHTYGSSLPMRYSARPIGVTNNCSSVPRSRSLTTDWLIRFCVDIIRMKASSAGTIVFTARIVGLNRTRTRASTPAMTGAFPDEPGNG